MGETKRRRGRPVKEDGARRRRLDILLTDEEFDRLNKASKLSGKSISEIARKGIDESVKREVFDYFFGPSDEKN